MVLFMYILFYSAALVSLPSPWRSMSASAGWNWSDSNGMECGAGLAVGVLGLVDYICNCTCMAEGLSVTEDFPSLV